MRKLLMVIDGTPECMNALRFAARRAEHNNDAVTMLYVIEPEDFEHWVSVREVMQAEAREEAEERMAALADKVFKYSGITPECVICEGKRSEAVLGQIAADKNIRILVLGASQGTEGPGPLVTELVGKHAGQLTIPVVVVPGSMSERDIDAGA